MEELEKRLDDLEKHVNKANLRILQCDEAIEELQKEPIGKEETRGYRSRISIRDSMILSSDSEGKNYI